MEKSSFFNSVSGDRKYNAQSFADFFNSFVTNGVFPNPSTGLQVIANNNMTITIKAGKAWINGYCYINDSNLVLPINVADGTLSRIDRIVIKFDTVARLISASVKSSSLATTPVASVLQRDSDKFELGIADVFIQNGVTMVTQANITDTRMSTTLCGWVNSLIQADTQSIFDQYQAWYITKKSEYDTDMVSWEASKKAAYDLWYSTFVTTEQGQVDSIESGFQSQFNTWFASVQSALNGDIAGNLLARIDAIPFVYRGITAPVSPRAIDYWYKEL